MSSGWWSKQKKNESHGIFGCFLCHSVESGHFLQPWMSFVYIVDMVLCIYGIFVCAQMYISVCISWCFPLILFSPFYLFSSHCFPPSFPPWLSPLLHLSARSNLSPFPSRKEQVFQGYQPNMCYHNALTLDTIPHIKPEQSNSIEKKRSQK